MNTLTLLISALFFIVGFSSGYLSGEGYRRYQVKNLRNQIEFERIKAMKISKFYRESQNERIY